ncbi:CARDB domain-containing protein, partial [Scytonema hofmannii]
RWVVVKTDAGGDVYEHGQESNNTRISSNPIDIRKSDFPNLKVSSVTARTDSAFSGQKITIDWVVENTGTGSTSAPIWYDAVFLSLNGQETYLGQTSNFSYLDKYGSGIHSYNNSLEVTLPDNIEGNNYYFVVKTDYYDNVYEYQNEDDNFRSTESPTNIELTPPPDLQPTVNEHSPVFSGQRMTLNWTVVNNGPGKTSQHSWYDEVYMSADPYLGNGDEEYFLGSRYHYGDLDVYDANSTNGATSSYTTSLDVTLPIGVSGNFYFIVRTDAGNQVLEFAGDANNIVAQPTPTTVNLTPPPDLEVELVDVPTQALASHALTIDYRVTNNGSTATPNYSWVDAFYLSEDANFNSSTDRLLGEIRHHGSLDIDEPNKWYDGSATFTLPDGLSGTFHVFVVTDQHNDVFELNNH